MTTGRMLREFFLNREDVVANLAPWGKPCPVALDGDLSEVLNAHLGESVHAAMHQPAKTQACKQPIERVGSYTPDADGLTQWMCIDLDGKGHADALADPLAEAEGVIATARELSLPSHLERSGGGRGFHVWIFFDSKIESRIARALGFHLTPRNAQLVDGSLADPVQNKGIEIFPKTDRAPGEGRLGNMVWLPWWSAAPEGCGEFYIDRGEGWELYEPTTFQRADSGLVAEIVSEETETSPQPKQPAKASQGPPVAWDQWRRDALSRLSVESVYGQWLTGKKDGKGWLECRDPASPTGDRNPSASVATGASEAEPGTFKSFRSGESISVFDFMIRHGTASSFIEAAKQIAELTMTECPPPKMQQERQAPRDERVNEPAPPEEPPPPEDEQAPPPRGPQQKPEIIINGRQLTEVVRDAWKAIRQSEAPKLYVRNGELVRVKHESEGARICLMGEADVFGALLRAAGWYSAKIRQGESYIVDAKPPNELPRDLMAYPHPGLPRLTSIVQAPTFDRDGRLVELPGFDEVAGVFYDEHEPIPATPESPTWEQVSEARKIIEGDVLVDFPFATQADRASAWATFLLPFVRRMVSSATPIHLIEAPSAGSGKSLLADLVTLTFTGKVAEVTTMSADEEETRKKITALLRRAAPIVTIDNMLWGSKSANFAASVTATTWTDRVLGKSEMIEMVNRTCWIVTVNNPELSVDLARRCIRIRLDAEHSRPWERRGFKHDSIREWVDDHRGKIVWALLVCIRWWVQQGMKQGEKTLGSFESWARIIGGILAAIGVDGFLENVRELYDQADSDTAEWLEFASVWHEEHHTRWVPSRDLVDLAQDKDLLGSVLGDRGPKSQRNRMSRALTRMRGRVMGRWRIVMGFNPSTKAKEYALTEAGEDEPQQDPEVPPDQPMGWPDDGKD